MFALLSAWVGHAPQLDKKANIGDRFIEDAVGDLLRRVGGLDGAFPVFSARLPLGRKELRVVNRCRALILCGSNMYHRTFWPGYIPLAPDLTRVRAPIVSFGVGWGGERPADDYEFRPSSRRAIARIARDFPVLSVRDVITARLIESQVAEAHGRVRVTGCPVLFHHSRGAFDVAGLAGRRDGDGGPFAPRSILFSSNERIFLAEQIALYRRVRALFPAARRTVVLNQASDQFTSQLDDPDARVFHSADAAEFYRLFDEHDFQIGFRLHNHMSFLSRSKPSVTVEVDGRTAGFAATYDMQNLAVADIERLDGPMLETMLATNAERLTLRGRERWAGMEDLLLRLASLPDPPERPFPFRLFG